MKRKVIRLAGKTLVVSLPSKWVKRYNVLKGQEVEIEENGMGLNLKVQSEPELKKGEFDARGQSDRIIRLGISGLHRKGCDEIDIIYDKPETATQIQELVRDIFLGFVIINQTKSHCVIKSISKDSREEFDNALRRAFLVTITMGDNILEALKGKDFKSMQAALNLEKTNNQLTSFCQRLLNKNGSANPETTCSYYIIAWNLEKVCDEYKYLVEYLLENPAIIRLTTKDTLSFIEESNILLKSYYELYYKFDRDALTNLSNRSKDLIAKGRSLLGSKNMADRVIASIMTNQIIRVTDFISSTIPLNV